jgi:hypothetical protein
VKNRCKNYIQILEVIMDKQKAWDYAIGLIKVDGLQPTPDFLELVEQEIDGKITVEDIERRLNSKYKMKGDKILESSYLNA